MAGIDAFVPAQHDESLHDHQTGQAIGHGARSDRLLNCGSVPIYAELGVAMERIEIGTGSEAHRPDCFRRAARDGAHSEDEPLFRRSAQLIPAHLTRARAPANGHVGMAAFLFGAADGAAGCLGEYCGHRRPR